MLNKLNLITKITLWVLFAVSIVVGALVFVGGDATPLEVGGESLWQPKFTDALIYWTYVLLALSLLITVVLSLMQFVQSFIANPKKGAKTLCILVAFVAVFVISWFVGSAEEITIVGYEGTDNMGFWAQFTDMCIYSIYILASGTVLALLGSVIYSKIK